MPTYEHNDLVSGQTMWIEESDSNRFHVQGLKCNRVKWFFSLLATFATVGFLRLLFYWKPNWHAKAVADKCSLSDAEMVLITNEHHQYSLRPVKWVDERKEGISLPCPRGQFIQVSTYRFFSYRKLHYVFHPQLMKYARIFCLDEQIPCGAFHDWAGEGLSVDEVARRLVVYGKNEISVKLKPILVLLFKEVLSPFYIFQLFSVVIWYVDEYYYYASVIIFISVISITADVYQTRKQEKSLRDMVHSLDMVTCMREGVITSMYSDGLVPGDVLVIPKHGCIMQCDAVLLSGTCIVNESMLTGESIPVTKTPLPAGESEPVYSNKEHGKHTLYCGTKVLQTRFYSGQHVKGQVIRTGYSTLKGQLVRSIMYPKPVDFHFTKDLLKFLGVLACIAAAGFTYAITLMAVNHRGLKKILIRSLDTITIVVPPALPAAMTIGILAAQMRLKKKKIFCISPSTINTCGAINVVCFDKTGTLTEDGLDFHCAVTTAPSRISGSSTERRFVEEAFRDLKELALDNPLLRAVVSCHSLTRIEGDICGDPLDLILFTETGWDLEEPDVVEESGRYDLLAPTVLRSPKGSNVEIGILRQFTFSSSLQRMSVISRVLGEQELILYCKGAPETVASLCSQETVPQCFLAILHGYAKHGYRVLGVARRHLANVSFVKAQRVPRDQVECEMEFLGLVVLENRLKPQTTPVIAELKAANIRTLMATGDNLLTAVSVGRDCGLLDPRKELFILDVSIDEELSGESFLQLRPAEAVLGHQNLQNRNDVTHIFDGTSAGMDPEGSRLKFGLKYQLAVTGSTFALLLKEHPDLVDKVVCVCDIFARVSPEQKSQVVDRLQGVDYVVAMCGDGANDCGALKAAHAGISLSEAEASIASPFTSHTPDIRCVSLVIKEGRAALVTSFGIIKYMAAYSLTQFFSVLLLYWIGTNLADFQFLYIDLFLITVFAVLFGYQDAADSLIPKPPPNRILSVPSVLSVVFNLCIIAAFQMFIFLFVEHEPWYVPFVDPKKEDNFNSYRGTCVFLLSLYQYIGVAVVYSKGFPYRKPIYNNRLFCIALVICTGISLWFTLCPPAIVIDILNLMTPLPFQFRLFLVILGALCFLLCYLCEKWIIDYLLLELRDRKKCCGKKESQEKYLTILKDVGGSPAWLSAALERKKWQKTERDGQRSPPTNWNNYGATSQSSSADEESSLLKKTQRLNQTVL